GACYEVSDPSSRETRDRLMIAGHLHRVAAVMGWLLAAGPADAADPLYEALLASRPAALPKGVAITGVAAAALSDDEKKDGVVGNVTLKLQATVPRPEIQYLVFIDAARAAATARRYAGWFETLAPFRTRLFPVSEPAGKCLMFEN